MIKRILVLMVAVTSMHAAPAQEPLQSNQQKASYGIGVQLAMQLLRTLQSQNAPLDQAAVLLAINDVMGRGELRLEESEIRDAMVTFQQEVEANQLRDAEKSLEQALAWLADNKNKEGVFETGSGLQYKIVKRGDGERPGPEDTVIVHYRGRLIDETEFDSSYNRGEPAEFRVGDVIPGWQEALVLMRPGDEFQIYVPPSLAYGERGTGSSIGPNQTLIFDVELIEIKPTQASTE